MKPMPSLLEFFPWLRPVAVAAVRKAPAGPPKAEEREAVQRWEDEGGNVK